MIAQRIQCLTLITEDFSVTHIERKTGIPSWTQRRIWNKAFDRGFRPALDPVIKEDYVIDGVRSGRPVQINEVKEQEVLAIVRQDRAGREKSSEVIGYEADISSTSVLRILHKHNLSSVKPTRKPGLSEEAKAARLTFALEHQRWTLEDWKSVIWTDETSVILGQRRGVIRIWRDPHETYNTTAIRNRWKGFSEFMWWSCFTWDDKGPWHIWKKETAQERKIADTDLQQLNEALEPLMRQEWELTTGVNRSMSLRGQPKGKKPVWKWNKKNGKLVRDSKGGIDWYRYGKLIVLQKIIPFLRQCEFSRATQNIFEPMIVQEDNATPHAHVNTRKIYVMANVERLLWPANSPDLNAIEPAWWWMKRRTTARGAPPTRKALERSWQTAWKELPQSNIQQWITRIPKHIERIIACEGGNEFEEGNQYQRSWKGRRLKGQLSTHSYLSPLQSKEEEEEREEALREWNDINYVSTDEESESEGLRGEISESPSDSPSD